MTPGNTDAARGGGRRESRSDLMRGESFETVDPGETRVVAQLSSNIKYKVAVPRGGTAMTVSQSAWIPNHLSHHDTVLVA